MRYCYECGRITAGEPLFCNQCGRTYDVKLCPRLHQNPRGAEICSQCGSRDLSTPQPKIPMSWRLLALVIQLGLGLLFFYISLTLLVDLLRTPQFQELLVFTGVIVSGLMWVYSKLPGWLQKVLRAIWRWKSHEDK
jgi:RNA polymerase subunit RPABC4/transcription elongation factor Spt4